MCPLRILCSRLSGLFLLWLIGAILPFKLDTGAKVNLINIRDVKALKERPLIQKRTVPLKAYNGQPIETQGICRLKIQVKGKTQN